MPNKISSVVGEIWHSLTWLNQSKTFWVNHLVNAHSIKECATESLSPQYKHSSSVFIPSLNISFLGLVYTLNLIQTNLIQIQFVDQSTISRRGI